jgi:AAA family ATPase
MSAPTPFTLRPLERNPPGTLLEGAFRVHITLKELKALKVSQGDLVRLSNSEGPKGVAVAWLATQTNPGNKPIAKVTDLLRDKYGLSLNDKIFIEKAEEGWRPIIAINIALPETPDALTGYTSTDDLLFWCRSALGVAYPIYNFQQLLTNEL